MEEDLNIDMNAPIGSYLDPIREMTGEQLKQQDEEEKAAEEAKAAEPQGLGLVVSETGAAIRGGGAQAVESVGDFAELAGDTFKTGFN